jgi:hypothetical protein
LLSLTIKRPTNSIARIAVLGGQCKAAVSKRLANAAERHTGETDAEARGEKATCKALNKRSDED